MYAELYLNGASDLNIKRIPGSQESLHMYDTMSVTEKTSFKEITQTSVSTKAPSCVDVFSSRANGNKAYPLSVGSKVLPVNCHMTDDLGTYGGGGWTLVMKIDGNKVSNSCVRKRVDPLSVAIIQFSTELIIFPN